MGDCDRIELREVLVLLDAKILGNITEKTYEWMSQQPELMAYVIMGEYVGAQKYMVQNVTDNMQRRVESGTFS